MAAEPVLGSHRRKTGTHGREPSECPFEKHRIVFEVNAVPADWLGLFHFVWVVGLVGCDPRPVMAEDHDRQDIIFLGPELLPARSPDRSDFFFPC